MERLYEFLEFLSTLNPIFLSFSIIIESIIPIFPVSVLMSISVVSYGFVGGFILSYISTLLGCLLSYMLTRYIFKHYILNHVKRKNKGLKTIEQVGAMPFSKITALMAFPFAPAFLFNILAALGDVRMKKFLAAIIISKLSLVYFWCFVGESIYTSLGDPIIIIQIIIMVLITYVISKIVSKKFGIS